LFLSKEQRLIRLEKDNRNLKLQFALQQRETALNKSNPSLTSTSLSSSTTTTNPTLTSVSISQSSSSTLPSNEIPRQSEANSQNGISRDTSLSNGVSLLQITTAGDNQSGVSRRNSISLTSSTATERLVSHETIENGQNKNSSSTQAPPSEFRLPNNK
jgi:hypothetical protein